MSTFSERSLIVAGYTTGVCLFFGGVVAIAHGLAPCINRGHCFRAVRENCLRGIVEVAFGVAAVALPFFASRQVIELQGPMALARLP